jgi:hypothetical protein
VYRSFASLARIAKSKSLERDKEAVGAPAYSYMRAPFLAFVPLRVCSKSQRTRSFCSYNGNPIRKIDWGTAPLEHYVTPGTTSCVLGHQEGRRGRDFICCHRNKQSLPSTGGVGPG